jgi:hypothetical protein
VRVRVRVRHREVHSDVTLGVAVDVFLKEREGGRRKGWREDGRESVSCVCGGLTAKPMRQINMQQITMLIVNILPSQIAHTHLE